jgi:hypothetical protein
VDAENQASASLTLIAPIPQYAKTPSAETHVNLQTFVAQMLFVVLLATMLSAGAPKELKATRKFHVITSSARRTANVI